MMIHRKKAQSALEFLTTYGWAFLVILIMIGALAYFGVLDPSRFLPDKCNAPAGVLCNGAVVDSATEVVQFSITNQQSKTLTIQTVTLGADVFGVDCGTPTAIVESVGSIDMEAATVTWGPEQEIIVEVTCGSDIQSGARPVLRLPLQYTETGSSLTKTMNIEVSSRAN